PHGIFAMASLVTPNEPSRKAHYEEIHSYDKSDKGVGAKGKTSKSLLANVLDMDDDF
ncbi:Acetylcholine receptor subunit alphatype acr16like, partial [Caligus rogercresseyi]